MLGVRTVALAALIATGPIGRASLNSHYITDHSPLSKRNQGSVQKTNGWLVQCGNQQDQFDRGTSLGKLLTRSRMVRNERPLRTTAAKPRNTKGKVSARNAKMEKPVAVVFST